MSSSTTQTKSSPSSTACSRPNWQAWCATPLLVPGVRLFAHTRLSWLREQANESLRHAEQVGEWITALGAILAGDRAAARLAPA